MAASQLRLLCYSSFNSHAARLLSYASKMAEAEAAETVDQQLPSWPPSGLTTAQVNHLATSAMDFAFAHGLVYRPLQEIKDAPVDTSSVIHAPFSLLPSPFPAKLFHYASSLQPIYNDLYARISLDDDLLKDIFVKRKVIEVDDFQRSLWDIYQRVKQEAAAQHLQLGLFRSDFLLHDESVQLGTKSSDAPAATESAHSLTVKQVEFNTISSSFGPLCALVSRLHQHLAGTTLDYFGRLPNGLSQGALPENKALQTLASGLAEAHKAYLAQTKAGRMGNTKEEEPMILFVTQPDERNAFDQRAIEYELFNAHNIRCIRKTLAELASMQEGHATSVRLPKHELFVTAPWSGLKEEDVEQVEISVVYYRAGYTPTDYEGKGNEKNWDARFLLEKSKAIKCPSVALQLAGAKKVQQVLSEEGVLERFLASDEKGVKGEKYGAEALAQLRASWSELYPLDPHSELGKQGYQLAMQQPQRFVLKPQREGGGNNIYKHDIPSALQEMAKRDEKSKASTTEREGYILMSLIQPPAGVGNLLVKAGAGAHKGAVLAPDVVSELGIYGTCLFGKTQEGVIEIPLNAQGGHLLRTKGRDSDEGGVAVGFSVIDSPYLV